MSTTGFTRVQFNAFEEALSSDLTRIGRLAGKELAEHLGDMATADAMYDPSGSASAPVGRGEFIPGQSRLCFIVTNGSNLNVLIDKGQGYTTGSADTTDQSGYNVVRWAATTIAVAPDASTPRMDLIVARPAEVPTDSGPRNVIIDPVTRTVQAQTVYKTVAPLATVLIITGTPAALGTSGSAPLPPAPAAGDLVLAELYVPPAVVHSEDFSVIRRTDRLVTGPLANYHGLLQGQFNWTSNGNEATAVSRCVGSPFAGPLRALIDGELLQSTDPVFDVGDNIGTQDPTAVAAAATHDKPYYLYLCGGRNKPQWNGPSGASAPFVLVRSTVPPDPFGRPSAPIGTPRGPTQAGALYVGIGFIIMNTTRGKLVSWDGDWCYAGSGNPGSELSPIGEHPVCFNQPSTLLTSSDGTFAASLSTVPAVSTRAKCCLAISSALISPDVVGAMCVAVRTVNGGTAQMVAGLSMPVGNRYGRAMTEFGMDPGQSMVVSAATTAAPGTYDQRVLVAAIAYNMNAPRLSHA